MYGNCLKCGEDVGELMTFDTLAAEYIECPKCQNKMVVDYDESYDEDTSEVDSWWSLVQYKKEDGTKN